MSCILKLVSGDFTLPQLSPQLFCLVRNRWCKLSSKERATNEIKCEPEQKQEGEGAEGCFLKSLKLQLA